MCRNELSVRKRRFSFILGVQILCCVFLVGCASNLPKLENTDLYPVKKIVMFWNGRPPIIELDIPPSLEYSDPYSREANLNRAAKSSYSTNHTKWAGGLLAGPSSRITTRVLTNGTALGYMNEPLCQSSPTLYLKLRRERWGPILYQNAYNEYEEVLSLLRNLIYINCEPGIIDSVKIVAYQSALGRQSPERRYLPFTEEEQNRVSGSRIISGIVYRGAVFADDNFSKIWPADLNGMDRYNRYFSGVEDRYERAQRRKRIFGSSTSSVTIEQYCKNNPDTCVKYALRIARLFILRR